MTELPLILFDSDICALLKISLTTLKRLRRKPSTFPIPELPSLDKRHRYSRHDVEAFLQRDRSRVLTIRRRAS